MPSRPCRWPTCTAYVRPPDRYCPEHAEHGAKETADRHAFYDQHQRDPEAKRFYDSGGWQRARATKLANDPVCERCRVVFAEHVHHRLALKRCTAGQKLEQRNLMSLCAACHNAIEAEATKAAARA